LHLTLGSYQDANKLHAFTSQAGPYMRTRVASWAHAEHGARGRGEARPSIRPFLPLEQTLILSYF